MSMKRMVNRSTYAPRVHLYSTAMASHLYHCTYCKVEVFLWSKLFEYLLHMFRREIEKIKETESVIF
jgi:hypothetical protein